MTGTALAFPTPASLGSLDHYIQAVNRFPLLTAEQETELGRRLQARRRSGRRARSSCCRTCAWSSPVSRNYLGYGLPQADLIQEGNIGLMKAVRRFDPERGVRLVSFALHWIRAEMHEYILRNWRLVKVATTKAQRKLFFNLRSMKPKLGRAVADRGARHRQGARRQARGSGRDGDAALRAATSRSTRRPDDDGETMTPIAYLTDTEDEPVQILEREETARNRSDGLQRALAKLDDRSRRIIEARWLREDDPATLQELADEYGVSAERIRQIESKAMKTMRGADGRVALDDARPAALQPTPALA